MSDYMFMLESHLSPEQNQVVSTLQAVAEETSVTVFLSGGTMRDMLGGFPIKGLDFTVEGNALKVARNLVARAGAVLTATDETRKSAYLVFPNGVPASIRSAHVAHYAKPGGKPQIQASTIHEDLRDRDFTINAIAMSLHRASRGLLLDPTNGIGDLERRELRATGNYALYNEPVRLLRLIRLRVRTGFSVEERTMAQFRNAMESGMTEKIPPPALLAELRRMAAEPNPSDLVEALVAEGLMKLFSPMLEGAKLNLAGLAKLQRVLQMVPFGADFPMQPLGLFLNVLTEKLSPKESAQMAEALEIPKEDRDAWHRLEARARKLEKAVQSPGLRRASQLYKVLHAAAGEEILYLLMHSTQRLVQDRIKNYLQRYLPAAMEVTGQELIAAGLQPGSAEFARGREELILKHLDARPKKTSAETSEEPPAVAAARK